MWKSVEMAIWTIRNISYFIKKIVGSQFLKNAAPGGQFLERLAYLKIYCLVQIKQFEGCMTRH